MNPTDLAAAGAVLSVILENLPFVRNPATAKWIKMAACVLLGLIYSLGMALSVPAAASTTLVFWQAVIQSAVTVILSMSVWHKVVDGLLPALGTTLFGRLPKSMMASYRMGQTSVSPATPGLNG